VPTDYDDLERRVTALEHEMRRVREDAAAARVLAGGADRDVAALTIKLDAHTKVLNALRETQLEHGNRLAALEARFDGLEARFDGLESEMREGFAKMAAGMAHIVTLIESIEGRD
jgi:chromosome segregation ATPase